MNDARLIVIERSQHEWADVAALLERADDEDVRVFSRMLREAIAGASPLSTDRGPNRVRIAIPREHLSLVLDAETQLSDERKRRRTVLSSEFPPICSVCGRDWPEFGVVDRQTMAMIHYCQSCFASREQGVT